MSPVDVAIVVAVAALVLSLPVNCALKGKWGFVLLGVLIHWFWIFGAVRLAKPGSWWARRRYGPAKLARAESRFD